MNLIYTGVSDEGAPGGAEILPWAQASRRLKKHKEKLITLKKLFIFSTISLAIEKSRTN